MYLPLTAALKVNADIQICELSLDGLIRDVTEAQLRRKNICKCASII